MIKMAMDMFPISMVVMTVMILILPCIQMPLTFGMMVLIKIVMGCLIMIKMGMVNLRYGTGGPIVMI